MPLGSRIPGRALGRAWILPIVGACAAVASGACSPASESAVTSTGELAPPTLVVPRAIGAQSDAASLAAPPAERFVGAVPPWFAPPSIPGAAMLTDFAGLPLLRPDEHARHASSYDRSGGDVDFGNAYGVDADKNWILLDTRGPGCVYRMWFTGFDGADVIEMYFDDETVPRVVMPLADLFSGKRAPFTAPLVGDATISSGGYFTYVPLPFAKSLRITVTPDANLYDNIDFHALPSSAQVTTWTGAEDLSAARAVWASAGTNPNGAFDGAAVTSGFDLAPGQAQTLFDGAGPGELTAIELRIPGLVRPPEVDAGVDGGAVSPGPGAMADVLAQLWVEMAWDEESPPSVVAPVGSLFALGDLGAGPSGGLMAGLRADGTLYLDFPMPFTRCAHVALTNRGATPIAGLWAGVEPRAFPFAFDQAGTFAVDYRTQTSVSGSDLTLLDTAGSGKLVGVVLTETKPTCASCFPRTYLEGDERVLVDEARTPVVLGTGTEDFFNGGFYFNRGPFGLPTHGNVAHVASPALDATSAYRFFLGDAIDFRSHLRLSLQHGPVDTDSVVASSLVYYYRQPRARLVAADALVVGDATSEAGHQYQSTGSTWQGAFTATWEGEFSVSRLTSTGRSQMGSSQFVMHVDPANAGVVLRRLLNQGTGNQRAQVFVNGVLAGDWLTAGANLNHAWREDDFPIPAAMTEGASSLAIEIRFVSSDLDWTEFEYETYSLLP